MRTVRNCNMGAERYGMLLVCCSSAHGCTAWARGSVLVHDLDTDLLWHRILLHACALVPGCCLPV